MGITPNQTINTMEDTRISMAKEGTTGAEQGQGQNYRFFSIKVWLNMTTLLMIKLLTKRITCKFSIVYKVQYVTRDQNWGNEAAPPPSWPSIASHSRFFGQTPNIVSVTGPLLSKHGSLQLAVPQTENSIYGYEIQRHDDPASCNNPKMWLWKMISAVEGSLEQMCGVGHFWSGCGHFWPQVGHFLIKLCTACYLTHYLRNV